ncbi:MAG: hypothetical protein AAB619_03500 [Patescibacteria group bacterium]
MPTALLVAEMKARFEHVEQDDVTHSTEFLSFSAFGGDRSTAIGQDVGSPRAAAGLAVSAVNV